MTTSLDPTRPGATHLTDEQLGALRALLTDELQTQVALLAEHRAEAASLIGANDADSIAERDLLDVAGTRAEEAILEIEAALAKLDDGSYGSCEDCGGVIAPERLEALPHARHCVSCPRPRSFLR